MKASIDKQHVRSEMNRKSDVKEFQSQLMRGDSLSHRANNCTIRFPFKFEFMAIGKRDLNLNARHDMTEP